MRKAPKEFNLVAVREASGGYQNKLKAIKRSQNIKLIEMAVNQ